MTTVLSYGGGRQTVAICVLIARGVLPRPDRLVMADTGRENPMTWAYLAAHIRPMLAPLGLDVDVIPRPDPPDVYSKAGKLIIPVFTETGKLSAYCSGTWKRDRRNTYLRQQGLRGGEMWIGFALEERSRVHAILADEKRGGWEVQVPLVELMLTTDDGLEVVRKHGLPPPPRSSCWMCPHKANAEWREIRDKCPAEWAAACDLDEELRESDRFNGGSGVWLHRSRVPLRDADLDEPETAEVARQCGLGMCFV